jgi:hypothetical protein
MLKRTVRLTANRADCDDETRVAALFDEVGVLALAIDVPDGTADEV